MFPAIAICISLIFLYEQASVAHVNPFVYGRRYGREVFLIAHEVEVFHVHCYLRAFVLSLEEPVVSVVEVLQVVETHVLFVSSSTFMYIVHEMWYRRAKVNHEVWLFHYHHHGVEEAHVSLIIAVRHVTHVMIVRTEDVNTLIYGPVLDDRLWRFLYLQKVSEALFKEIHLQVECPSRHVLIIVFEIRIICHAL
nr:MAG TPA: hypothetical protein [Caudoviricetes sp.]